MSTTTNISLEDTAVSKKYAKELEQLIVADGCDSIRFFIAPDKDVSAESVIEDARAFFIAKKTRSGFKTVSTIS